MVLCIFLVVLGMWPLNMIAYYIGGHSPKSEILEEIAENPRKKEEE